MGDTPTDDVRDDVDDADDRIDEAVDDLSSGLDDVRGDLDDLSETGETTAEDVGDIKETVTETRETVEDIRGTVDETQETVDATSETVEDTNETVGETQETVEDIDTTTRETRDTVDEMDETLDETQATAEDTNEAVDDLSEFLTGDYQDRLDELLDEKDARREDVEEEKDARREDVERLKDEVIEKVEDQVDLAKEYSMKMNADLLYMVGALQADSEGRKFDHTSYQHAVAAGAQALGVDGVDDLDITDPEVVKTVRAFYGEDDSDLNVLSDPLTGMNAWGDKDGYGSVLRHTWTRMVDETADYLAEMDAQGADVSQEVQDTVLSYLGEAGAAVEETADSATHGRNPDRQVSALMYLDKKAHELDRHLQSGQYEEAAETLDEVYGETLGDFLEGETEVGA